MTNMAETAMNEMRANLKPDLVYGGGDRARRRPVPAGGEGPRRRGRRRRHRGNGGAGFGLTAKPAGMYVIRDGTATWQPAIDINRVILGGQLVLIVALLVLRSVLRNR